MPGIDKARRATHMFGAKTQRAVAPGVGRGEIPSKENKLPNRSEVRSGGRGAEAQECSNTENKVEEQAAEEELKEM
eukprot:304293-Rhodomonas_salina.3